MGLKSQFKTNAKMETTGILVDFPPTVQVLAARAGGSNKRYKKLFAKKTKHIRRALATDNVPEEETRQIMVDVFTDTIVLGWETKIGGTWHKGIDPTDAGFAMTADGWALNIKKEDALPHELAVDDLLPPTKENVTAVFEYLPEMFESFVGTVSNAAAFAEDASELASGN